MNEEEYLVNIPMCVYNHENFIAKAIEGILMQRTTFKFKLIIGEDYSTDNSRDIIRQYLSEYPDKIQALFHDRNLGAHQNSRVLFRACRSKYIALCDGDDYWTDPDKLQKQVDFLEANQDFAACSHFARVLQPNGEFTEEIIGKFEKSIFAYRDFAQGYRRIPSASLLFRRFFDESPKLLYSVYGGDRALLFLLSKIGLIRVLEFEGSVYRIHNSSAESTFRTDKKKLAQRNIDENSVYLELVEPKFKIPLAKKIRWNYFYLILMNLREAKVLTAFSYFPWVYLRRPPGTNETAPAYRHYFRHAPRGDQNGTAHCSYAARSCISHYSNLYRPAPRNVETDSGLV
jgi:glycosyltransferase involved in cell wall biosynthesis